ncbi:hypothetical protein LGR54_05515 [Ancylobacter sp. Lp-2]|uniref:hypothetical protein n=1 Tax=Ancylobacter sp. Lp-2 TaxID=2881339 RepID=UPI001E404092|nr:hypothetical protein [Ancylobacter sp. Lp-2]MCB4768054.1 hypothetical protein [Ancylobacter sp. Lp-2]
MAELASPALTFGLGCPDCGERRAVLPLPIPSISDDFDWRMRDYDSFRLFMMQELSSRFPERRRWTSADVEVVIVELLAAALDRASNALDAVHAERYLETARRPQSIRRLLKLIGYDAVERVDPAVLASLPPPATGITETPAQQLERYWRLDPQAMEAARTDGPRLTGEVRRMVTLGDHEAILTRHPMVARARARLVWSGAWSTVLVATLLEDNRGLDEPLHSGPLPADGKPSGLDEGLWREIVDFHRVERLPLPPVNESLTARALLRGMVELNRMIGTEVFLEVAKAAPVSIALSVRAKRGYFRSELKQALYQVFTDAEDGFFEPGRLGFGEDLFASDIIDAAMRVEGVAVACLNRFKRVGSYPDQAGTGVVAIADDEFAFCANHPSRPQDGTFRISVNAGDGL